MIWVVRGFCFLWAGEEREAVEEQSDGLGAQLLQLFGAVTSEFAWSTSKYSAIMYGSTMTESVVGFCTKLQSVVS